MEGAEIRVGYYPDNAQGRDSTGYCVSANSAESSICSINSQSALTLLIWSLQSTASFYLGCTVKFFMLLTGLLACQLVRAQDLPPPPGQDDLNQPIKLLLELFVNQSRTFDVVPVSLKDGHFYIAPEHLRAIHIPTISDNDSTPVAIDQIPQIGIDYDAALQRLYITLPVHWLPHQFISKRPVQEYDSAQVSPGLLLNYELYLTAPQQNANSAAMLTELRFFSGLGTVRSSGRYQTTRGSAAAVNDGYVRLDTNWRYSNQDSMMTYQLGDLITQPLLWSNAVRLGGVQISKDFDIRPDVITYPLPEFSGTAAVPTSVDLFVNGYRNSSTNVDPGPFTVTDVPSINGAGEATIVTTDALGRQVSTTVPFYVSQELLERNLSDYSFSLGTLRREYGQRNYSYGNIAANASYRYGFSDKVTLESHVEVADRFGLLGFGAAFLLNRFGTLNTSYSYSSNSASAGRQLSASYEFNHRAFTLAMRHTRRQAGYRDLTVYENPSQSLAGKTSQLIASARLGNYGSLGSGVFDIESNDGSRTRLLNLSWSRSLGTGSMFFTANKEMGGDWSLAFQFTLAGRNRHMTTATVEHSAADENKQRISYRRTVPSEGGWGWSANYSRNHRSNDYRQADLQWQGRNLQLRGGFYGRDDNEVRWGEASGSIVWMQNKLYAAPRVRDSFVVVSTNGMAGVPILYENQPMGKTDDDGFLLVPWSSAYYPGNYEIDALALPTNVATSQLQKRVSVRSGAGYLLSFLIKPVVSALVKLVDTNASPLPVGAIANSNSGSSSYVGWDGMAYFEDIGLQTTLSVTLPGGDQCTAQFAVAADLNHTAQVGAVVCE